MDIPTITKWLNDLEPLTKDKKIALALLMQSKEEMIQSKDQMIQSMDQIIQSKDQIIKEMIHSKDQELAVKKLQYQRELKNLEDKLCKTNYRLLLTYKLLSVRSFVVFVRDEILGNANFTQKLKSLFNNKPDLFTKWKIDNESCADIYSNLMAKLNENTHPFFHTQDNFIINADDLKKEELKLIGLLWSAVPLSDQKLFIKKTEYQPLDADVIIIGAGVAGMTAAYVLTQKDPSLAILVLEARDRIGGRTFSTPVDIGGQWISSQQEILLDLIDQLGIKIETNHNNDKVIVDYDGKISNHTKQNALDVCSPVDKLELGSFITKIETLCKQESLDETIASMTVEQYMKNNVSSLTVQAIIKSMILGCCGVEASNMSLGFYIFFCISTHGVSNQLISKADGLREFRLQVAINISNNCLYNRIFQNGAQEICNKIAATLESNVQILRDSKVIAIKDQNFQLEIKTDEGRSFFSSSVLVAAPPCEICKIHFTPQLPRSKLQILQKSVLRGHLVKFIATYLEEFWKKNGYSGDIYVLDGYGPSRPLLCCWDATTGDTAALSGYLVQDAKNIKFLLLEQLCEYFGSLASAPLELIIVKWPDGSPMSCYKTFQDFKETRSENGRIVWASAETSLEWYGCISGAVYAANRAAREVLYDIRPGTLTLDDMMFFTSNVTKLQKSSQSFTTIYKKLISPYYQAAALVVLVVLIRMWRKGTYSYIKNMLIKK